MKKFLIITDTFKKNNRFILNIDKGESQQQVLDTWDENSSEVKVMSLEEGQKLANKIITKIQNERR